MSPLVVHCKQSKYDIYIGRKNIGNHYGNPWSHLMLSNTLIVANRDDAINNYRAWLKGDHSEIEPERRTWILNNIHLLHGKVLGCFCAPLACHGEILVEMAEEISQSQEKKFFSWLG